MAMQLIGGPQDGLAWTGSPDKTICFSAPISSRPNEPRLLHIYEQGDDGHYRYVGVDVEDPDDKIPQR